MLKNPVMYTKLGLRNLQNSATFDLSDIKVNSSYTTDCTLLCFAADTMQLASETNGLVES